MSNCATAQPTTKFARRSVNPDHVPVVWPWLYRWFAWYSRRFVARNFHAVRLLDSPLPAVEDDCPLVVYMNHPGWWDPLVGLLFTEAVFPQRQPFAPMDARALDRYRFFGRLGFFAVDPSSLRGAAQFARVSLAVLQSPRAALWITAEGAFTDPRRRPVQLERGIGHLARHLRRGCFLPIAVEYSFWQERYPEVLLALGEAVWAEQDSTRSAGDWTELLARNLEQAQDRLAAASMARDAGRFRTILRGRSGIGGVYDAWRRAAAWWRGVPFRSEHGEAPP